MNEKLNRVGWIQLGQIPEDIQESIRKEVLKYTTGLIGISKPELNIADLLGSGTFVRIGEKYCILTAGHVIQRGIKHSSSKYIELGLTISSEFDDFSIPTSTLDFEYFYSGGKYQPDIGVIIIPDYFVRAIKVERHFWDIVKNGEISLNSVKGIDNYVTAISGFPNENTKEVDPQPGYKKTLSISGMCGFIGNGDICEKKNGFDYAEYLASYDWGSEPPEEFKGMSGGGCWKIVLEKLQNGELKHSYPLLFGVILRETDKIQNQKSLICHGPKSIYNKLSMKVMSSGSKKIELYRSFYDRSG